MIAWVKSSIFWEVDSTDYPFYLNLKDHRLLLIELFN
jgi:hypothetical protein